MKASRVGTLYSGFRDWLVGVVAPINLFGHSGFLFTRLHAWSKKYGRVKQVLPVRKKEFEFGLWGRSYGILSFLT